MKIVTWNVNSIRSRLDRLVAWLAAVQPDVVCLQELKTTDDAFPLDAIREAGYHAAFFGQKTYNGVAILSRREPADVRRGLPGFEDPEARLISAKIGRLWVASVYVPNGQEVGTAKYQYKLNWLARFRAFAAETLDPKRPMALCGDFNIARDDLDVYDPAGWADSVLFTPAMREELAALLGQGWRDLLRERHPEGHVYSWWDYRMLAFPKNRGLRLDYILASESLARHCREAEVDRQQRKGEKPSDHAPVVAEFHDEVL